MSKRCVNCKHCEKIFIPDKKPLAFYLCWSHPSYAEEITKPYNLNHCKNFERKETK